MKNLFLISFFLLGFLSFSQKIETELISKNTLQADRFLGADLMGNIYYVKNNIFYKKNKTETLTYSNVNYGDLFSADLQNPFKIVLFYKDYNTVIILDNKLNELTPAITFSGTNISLVNFASENNLWIYSRDNNILQLFNYQNRNYELTSQPLSFYKSGFMADNMINTYKKIWVFDRGSVLQFNEYVSFIQEFSLKDISKLFPFKKGFICLQNEQLTFYDETGEKTPVDTESLKKNPDLFILKDHLYVYKNGKVYNYRLK